MFLTKLGQDNLVFGLDHRLTTSVVFLTLKIQLQYISKIWNSRRLENQNPETRKVTLDYKFDLPVVEFGIKFHGSDDKCQIRGSGRSRTIELDACEG